MDRSGGIPGCDGATAEAGRPEDAGTKRAEANRGTEAEVRLGSAGREESPRVEERPVDRVRTMLERAMRFDADGDRRGAFRLRREAGILALDAGLPAGTISRIAFAGRTGSSGRREPAEAAGRAAGGDPPAPVLPAGGTAE